MDEAKEKLKSGRDVFLNNPDIGLGGGLAALITKPEKTESASASESVVH